MPRSKRRKGAKKRVLPKGFVTREQMPRGYYDPGKNPQPRRPDSPDVRQVIQTMRARRGS